MLENIEKLSKMREQVKSEMRNIPRGSTPQNLLRMYYWGMRMNSVGKKIEKPKSKEEVFKEVVQAVRKKYPDFEPVCKGEFQKIKV